MRDTGFGYSCEGGQVQQAGQLEYSTPRLDMAITKGLTVITEKLFSDDKLRDKFCLENYGKYQCLEEDTDVASEGTDLEEDTNVSDSELFAAYNGQYIEYENLNPCVYQWLYQ